MSCKTNFYKQKDDKDYLFGFMIFLVRHSLALWRKRSFIYLCLHVCHVPAIVLGIRSATEDLSEEVMCELDCSTVPDRGRKDRTRRWERGLRTNHFWMSGHSVSQDHMCIWTSFQLWCTSTLIHAPGDWQFTRVPETCGPVKPCLNSISHTARVCCSV